MRFAHMSDCHVGAWRDPKLNNLNTKAFERAVNICIKKEVDFVLISGDLFNTSLPAIDNLKTVTARLKDLSDMGINVYIVAGSHDFSPSGKTILDVLEKAGLFINVVKGKVVDEKLKLEFTVDKKTGAKITGMLGKKGMLEKSYYTSLDRTNLEKETGFKIFMFHTALTEFKPKELEQMDSHPLSLLPKGFDYYAGGHVHYVFEKNEPGYGLIVYPGPTFPNNFAEIEKLGHGGFYIYENGTLTFEPINVVGSHSIKLDYTNKTAEQATSALLEEIKNKRFDNTLVTIRLSGQLESGRPGDIDFKEIFSSIYEKGAYFVMKNISKLTTKEFEEIRVAPSSVEEVESMLINEHVGQIKLEGLGAEKEKQITKKLMSALSSEKQEGETVTSFEKRIKEDVLKILELEKTV